LKKRKLTTAGTLELILLNLISKELYQAYCVSSRLKTFMSRYLSWRMKILLETFINLLKYNMVIEEDY
jgi:hypothetical protein